VATHPSRPPDSSLDVWHRTFDANFFGTIAVTQAFLPLLRAAAGGPHRQLSSILASLALHADPNPRSITRRVPPTNAPKTALNAWTVSLAYELRDSPIKVNAAHPGHVPDGHGRGLARQWESSMAPKSSVALATLGADGPSGTFTHMGKTLPW